MAKRKKTSASSKHRWQPRTDDAIRLAALRWFALELERLSIEIYASNQALYPQMEHALRQAVQSMGGLRRRVNVADDGDCPDGYFLCKDGICAPMCDAVGDAE
jgi:hypothetical protein